MDYDTLLRSKIRYGYLWITMTILLVGVSIFILNQEIYDTQTFKGISKENNIYLHIPIIYSDTFKNGSYIMINKDKRYFEIESISEILVDESSFLQYQEYVLKTDKEFKDNEILILTIYYNKEKILDKIKKWI